MGAKQGLWNPSIARALLSPRAFTLLRYLSQLFFWSWPYRTGRSMQSPTARWSGSWLFHPLPSNFWTLNAAQTNLSALWIFSPWYLSQGDRLAATWVQFQVQVDDWGLYWWGNVRKLLQAKPWYTYSHWQNNYKSRREYVSVSYLRWIHDQVLAISTVSKIVGLLIRTALRSLHCLSLMLHQCVVDLYSHCHATE